MVKTTVEKVLELMKSPDIIRNISISAHIDHGKTTLSDNLLAGAGMISTELAGKQRVLDFDEQEQARGITINSANVSMVHEVGDRLHLINLIDTPGHVDFGGDVTRAMRAVDGTVVLACAVEGVMPQTETVLRQALRERVKPILFINKVDRLIKELQLTPEQMQERFMKTIAEVNKFIEGIAPEEYKDKWKVNVQDGSVVFGSAYHNWALSIPYMQQKNITFKNIIDAYNSDEEWKKLISVIPLHEALLDSVVKHHPNPIDAQKYRIPKLWHGDMETETGKSLMTCNQNGPTVAVVFKIIIDPNAGEVAYCRLFSGRLKKGQELRLIKADTTQRTQQISIIKGAQRLIIDDVPAGNIVGVVGLKNATSGETITTESDIPGFEAITHLFEPVVTKAIEAKNPKDLPKLISVLQIIAKEDPTLKVEINEETGENLISGLGELHLEIWEYRIKHDKHLDIVTSPPIVVYRETVQKKGGPIEGKSPNKHNKLFVTVEPLEPSVYKAIKAGEIPELKLKKRKPEIEQIMMKFGLEKEEAKRTKEIYKGNILIDETKGIVHIGEIIEMVMEAFEEVGTAGPIAKEPAYGLKIKLVDCKLHEDSIHRGPGQIIPAMRQAVFNAMLEAGVTLFEPMQIIRVDSPVDQLGNITKLISGRRGQLLETQQEREALTVMAKMPVADMMGFTNDLRSASAGRAAWFVQDQTFEKLPNELQTEVIGRIRKRKGLPPEIPKPQVD